MKKCRSFGCFSDALCADGCCVQHTRRRAKKRGYSFRKYPKTDEPHLGIEIECYAKTGGVYSALLALSKAPSDDNSLPVYGCEFKLLKPARTAASYAAKFVRRLSEVGAEVNSSCGLHVHLDARAVDYRRQAAFIDWLAKWQKWWFGIMPPSRRNNTYLRWLPDNTHYAWAHISPFETIEIRIHGGTLNPHKVEGWISVCRCLLNLLRSDAELPALPAEGVTTEFLDRVFPDRVARAYIAAREAGDGVLGAGNVAQAVSATAELEV